jgi:multiple sugar transport system permease protein
VSYRRVALIVLFTGLFLLPLAAMTLGALRDPTDLSQRGIALVSTDFRFANFRDVFSFAPLWTFMRNSGLVVLIAVPVTVVVASMAGFGIARAEPRVARRWVIVSLVAMMIPVVALWIPRFVMFKWAGLLDTIWPLVSPALMGTTPFYVLLFALVYSRLPRSLFEAAEVDGLSPLQTWWRVAWPLARPATFAIAVLAFVWHWSNFFDPLIYLSTEERFTMPLGMRSLATLEPRLFPLTLAGALIATVPPVLAFLVAQRAFFRRTLEVG